MRIALIAHDAMKPHMIKFAQNNKEVLALCDIVATGTTGTLIHEHTGLEVRTVLSGPIGGDQQIGSQVACGQVDFVIFLRDPLSVQPHEPDISALLRICDVHNIPLATNERSAHILISHLKQVINQ